MTVCNKKLSSQCKLPAQIEPVQDKYIILLFNSIYKRQWINVIFLQDKHNINAVS